MRKSKREAEDQGLFGDVPPVTSDPAAPPAEAGRLMPVDIQQKEFRLGFRGYREAEVDEFLDQVTEELGKLHEELGRLRDENRRLRDGGAAPTTPFSGGAEIAEARRQSEDIVRRAREEAERMLREASAAAPVAAAASTPGGGGAAEVPITPFLSKEREFLQSMATLIQGHAEYVKMAAKAARRSGSAPAAPAPAPEAAATGAAAAAVAPLAAGTPVESPAASAPTPPVDAPQASDLEREEPPPLAPTPVESPEAAPSFSAPQLPPEPEPEPEPEPGPEPDVEALEPPTPEAEGTPDAGEPGPADAEPELGEVDLSPWQRMQTGPEPQPRRDTTGEPTAAWQNPFSAGRSDEESSSLDEPGAVSSSLEQDAPTEGGQQERSLRELFWGEE